MRKRRFRFAVIGLAAAAVLATAVGAGARTNADPKSLSGTIRFSADITTQVGYDILIANFKRVYPNVTVNAEYVANNQRPILLNAQLAAGTAPDVIVVFPGHTLVPSILELQKAGYLADLSSSPWVKRIPAFAKPLVTVGGKPYGWLDRVSTPALFYNKDIFQNLGLTVPRTFGQLLDLCRTIRQKAPNMIPISLAGSQITTLIGQVIVSASSTVYARDPNWNAKRERRQTSFQSTPGWRAAFQRYVDQKNAGCYSTGVAADTAASTFAQFTPTPAQSAMLTANTGFLGPVRALNPRLNLGMFLFPSDTQAGTYMTIFPSDTLAVNAKSSNMAAARAFVDFLAREKQNSLLSKLLGSASPFDYQKVFNNAKEGIKLLDKDHQVFVPYVGRIVVAGSTTWPSTAPFTAMGQASQGLLTGQKTVDEVLKAGDDAWPK